jgi:predicted DNA-binding protein with PD1-like motif
MDAERSGDRIVVRLDPGDEVLEELSRLRDEHGIDSGFFMGIGAVDRVTLGHYDVSTEEYTERTFEGQFEVMNFKGNIGPDKIHAHITVGDDTYRARGGHCSGARVSGTFEIIVLTTDVPLEHRRDERTGLDVFDI